MAKAEATQLLMPNNAREYLGMRLDGARDLYLVSLALGQRDENGKFGRMIREARIHFAAVLEEARIAGLETSAIASILSSQSPEDGFRPELRAHVDALLARRR